MRQKEAFRTQLLIAIEYKLPIVIHCRDADMDCFNIMKEVVKLGPLLATSPDNP